MLAFFHFSSLYSTQIFNIFVYLMCEFRMSFICSNFPHFPFSYFIFLNRFFFLFLLLLFPFYLRVEFLLCKSETNDFYWFKILENFSSNRMTESISILFFIVYFFFPAAYTEKILIFNPYFRM